MVLSRQPACRLGRPDEVAYAAHHTGETTLIDSGWTAA